MPTTADALPPGARAALLRAHQMPLSYAVRLLVGPGPEARLVVALGEAHVKLAPAAALGREVVEEVALRGVETFQAKQILAGGVLRWLIYLPRLALRALTLGMVKGSTIVEAKQASHGHTEELERTARAPLSLHVASLSMSVMFATFFAHLAVSALRLVVPGGALDGLDAALRWVNVALQWHMVLLLPPALLLRRHPWSWLLHPMAAILTARDTLMADGMVRLLADHPDAGPALAVMGRAHLPGFERELCERHGFRRVEFP
jgi:hypothetical protein